MLIYCFNGQTLTSIQKTWQTVSLYWLKYHHLIHLLPYYRLSIIKTSRVLPFSRILVYFEICTTCKIHPLNGPLSRTTQVSRTRKVKPIWILLEHETVGGSGISWARCKSAPRSRQITTPAPTTQFLQAGCPSCRPTNSVKALNTSPNIFWSSSQEYHYLVIRML